MKKLLGITIFLLLVYTALLCSDPSARTFVAHERLAERISLEGILTLAVGMLIVSGGIDLSIGSLVCLCCTVFGLLVTKHEVPVYVGFLVTIVLAGLVGLINGLLVTKLHLQPFMVTLCGLLCYRSLARWLAGGAQVNGVGEPIKEIAEIYKSGFWGIPVYLTIFVMLVLLAGLFMHRSVHGRYLFALGSNERAARFAGVAVDFYRILAYVLCSMLVSLYSFLFLMRYPSVEPSSTGQNLELIAISGAVLGGCTLRGGTGTVYGMVVGTSIIIILPMIITLTGISSSLEDMVTGGILLLGVTLDEVLRRRDTASRAP